MNPSNLTARKLQGAAYAFHLRVRPVDSQIRKLLVARPMSLAARKIKIGTFDTYWTIFDFTEKQEPVQGSLAGDISEIYFDLKECLNLKENGVARSDVLFDWRLAFRSHWGRHLLTKGS